MNEPPKSGEAAISVCDDCLLKLESGEIKKLSALDDDWKCPHCGKNFIKYKELTA